MIEKEHEAILKDATSEIANVAGWLWQRGWAERNAGYIGAPLAGYDPEGLTETQLDELSKLKF